ncbi:MAG: 2-oxoisovalerate dehydrogenase [Syntrophobacteraceae bacterium]
MATEIIFIVEESIEGGFEARCLAHSISMEADTLEALRSMVKDAVRSHFEEKDRPTFIRLHFVKDEILEV